LTARSKPFIREWFFQVGTAAVAEFSFDPIAFQQQVRDAEKRSRSTTIDTLLQRASRSAGLNPDEVALLWYAPVPTDVLYAVARATRRPRSNVLETFSPLYLTNTCDAECRMCGMRRDNSALVRETAELDEIMAQLCLLRRRGMRAVALLTGEYAAGRRSWAMAYVNKALRATQALGFTHVLVNVGSVGEDEFDSLLDGIQRQPDGSLVPKLTMSTFQETYWPRSYTKFMGRNPDNPRADFQRRLKNFDRAHRAGMRFANPGILVGLNPDVAFDLAALVMHARHLLGLGMQVYLSLPRLRRIAGSGGRRGLGDADFVRVVALLSLAVPHGKIVITTRENPVMQHQLAPIVSVISAGSASVAPYTESGARFPLEASQFEVIDQRPFEAVLNEHERAGMTIVDFEPPGRKSLGDQAAVP
jgi:2-iminoacetate synthase